LNEQELIALYTFAKTRGRSIRRYHPFPIPLPLSYHCDDIRWRWYCGDRVVGLTNTGRLSKLCLNHLERLKNLSSLDLGNALLKILEKDVSHVLFFATMPLTRTKYRSTSHPPCPSHHRRPSKHTPPLIVLTNFAVDPPLLGRVYHRMGSKSR
jgi:hypothetical protein